VQIVTRSPLQSDRQSWSCRNAQMVLFLLYLYLAVIDETVEGLNFTECGNNIIFTNDKVFQQHYIITNTESPQSQLRRFGFQVVRQKGCPSTAKEWHHPLFTARQRDLKQLIDLPREVWVSTRAQPPVNKPFFNFRSTCRQLFSPYRYTSVTSVPSAAQHNQLTVRHESAASLRADAKRAPLDQLFGGATAWETSVTGATQCTQAPLTVEEAIQWCETFGCDVSAASAASRCKMAASTARAARPVREVSKRVKQLRGRLSNSGYTLLYTDPGSSQCQIL
jgi:hypothetical protein